MDREEIIRVLARVFVLGLIAGIMVAPQPGEETRRNLKAKILKMKGEFEKKIAEVAMMDRDEFEEKIDELLDEQQEAENIMAEDVVELKNGAMAIYDRIQEEF